MRATITLKGGPGSGHHGHSGRPGKHGGSSPGKGGGGGVSTSPRESIQKAKMTSRQIGPPLNDWEYHNETGADRRDDDMSWQEVSVTFAGVNNASKLSDNDVWSAVMSKRIDLGKDIRGEPIVAEDFNVESTSVTGNTVTVRGYMGYWYDPYSSSEFDPETGDYYDPDDDF